MGDFDNPGLGRSLYRGGLAGVAIFLLAAAFLVSRSSSPAPGRDGTGGGPMSAWPGVFDLGNIAPSQQPTVGFTLRNDSAKPITISQLIPSCACVAAKCTPRTLVPSGAAKLSLTLNASAYADYQGPFSKYVSIIYRIGEAHRMHVLRVAIEGNLVDAAPCFAYPSAVALGDVRRGRPTDVEVYLTGRAGVLRELPKSVLLAPGATRVIVLSGTPESGGNFDRRLGIRMEVPATARRGRFRSRVLLHFSDFSPVVITICGRVVPARTGHRRAGGAAGPQR